MKALLIAEKPSFMRDVQAVYNKFGHADTITFAALRGHVLGLDYPAAYDDSWGAPWTFDVLPMIPEKFKYRVIVKDVFENIKKEITSGKYDYIINACDAGREGELIFYSVYKHIGKKIPVKRFWASDTTEKTIKHALDNLIDDNEFLHLKASAQFRSQFDWLLGMNLSRAVSIKAGTSIPCGRVMTPTLGIVVSRELEIQNFVPKKYFEIESDYQVFKGQWFNEEENISSFDKREDAEQVLKSIASETEALVTNVEKTKEPQNAPTLHSLLELQKEANAAFGYTADKTLSIAQTLYESKKLITYPRTESRYLPKNLAAEISKHLNALRHLPELQVEAEIILKDPSRIKKVMGSTRYVDDKKISDHHAIIPTDQIPNMGKLTTEELNIYSLVAKRFLAIFMDPAEFSKTLIITTIGKETFKTSGKILSKEGFRRLYKTSTGEELPDVKIGDKLPVKRLNIRDKETTPPQRYNDASLLQAMQNAGRFIDEKELQKILRETEGLGTSATRAEILKKLVEKKMIERKGKTIFPTDFGMDVIKVLNNHDITSPELTAVWEKKLKDIENKAYGIKEFYAEMKAYTGEATREAIQKVTSLGNKYRPTNSASKKESKPIGKCPVCGANVIESKNCYFCENYKREACKFVIGKTICSAKITKTHIKEILKSQKTSPITFTWKSGKTGNARLVLKDGKTEFSFEK